ncbi:uncharacterized protein LOC34621329 [Cyclospora cayetanensis]|uniref:Uncharacterized protein LOC34621329 n=1 Tax=Cyclospora cayetanensis TaxID=88456 RepID=A0A6P6RZ90_9EIME|nr:uncharacterized protein LOC34621329 [Cyclospora cayetanensis]
MMPQPTDPKPEVQLICERLIEHFASRIEVEPSISLPKEIKEKFIRVWREGTVERLRNQTLAFPESVMLACYRGALVSVCAGVFVEILQADGRPLALLSDHAFDEERFVKMHGCSRMGAVARVGTVGLVSLGSLVARELCGLEVSLAVQAEREGAQVPEDQTGANVDKLGPEGDCLAGRVGLSAEEVAFLSENRLAPPPLSDLTELIPEADAPDKIIGHFDKVSRPADSSRPLSMERSATWGIIIRDGIIKVGGQEFAFSRLDAELKEL